jgi:hypothetical protein
MNHYSDFVVHFMTHSKQKMNKEQQDEKKVLDCLEKGPKRIVQIVVDTKLPRSNVKRKLSHFGKIGIVKKRGIDWFLTEQTVSFNNQAELNVLLKHSSQQLIPGLNAILSVLSSETSEEPDVYKDELKKWARQHLKTYPELNRNLETLEALQRKFQKELNTLARTQEWATLCALHYEKKENEKTLLRRYFPDYELHRDRVWRSPVFKSAEEAKRFEEAQSRLFETAEAKKMFDLYGSVYRDMFRLMKTAEVFPLQGKCDLCKVGVRVLEEAKEDSDKKKMKQG